MNFSKNARPLYSISTYGAKIVISGNIKIFLFYVEKCLWDWYYISLLRLRPYRRHIDVYDNRLSMKKLFSVNVPLNDFAVPFQR